MTGTKFDFDKGFLVIGEEVKLGEDEALAIAAGAATDGTGVAGLLKKKSVIDLEVGLGTGLESGLKQKRTRLKTNKNQFDILAHDPPLENSVSKFHLRFSHI